MKCDFQINFRSHTNLIGNKIYNFIKLRYVGEVLSLHACVCRVGSNARHFNQRVHENSEYVQNDPHPEWTQYFAVSGRINFVQYSLQNPLQYALVVYAMRYTYFMNWGVNIPQYKINIDQYG